MTTNELTTEQKWNMTGAEIAAWNTANNGWQHTVTPRRIRRKPVSAYFAPKIVLPASYFKAS